MSDTYKFPTAIHAIAHEHYNHRPQSTTDHVCFILNHIDGRKAGILRNIYLKETQFTRHQKIREKWNQWHPEPEEQLKREEINILIFLLNMYGCKIAKKKRKAYMKKCGHF